MSVRPKFSTRGSDSLPTGRSSTLYVSSRSFSSLFSWKPPLTSPVANHNQQSVRSCTQSVATISLVHVACVASPRFEENVRNGSGITQECPPPSIPSSLYLPPSPPLSFSLCLFHSVGVQATFIFLRLHEPKSTSSIYLPHRFCSHPNLRSSQLLFVNTLREYNFEHSLFLYLCPAVLFLSLSFFTLFLFLCLFPIPFSL